jgi:hypothetical protein
MSDVLKIDVRFSMTNSVLQTAIQCSPKLSLMSFNPSKMVLIGGNPHVT